MFTQCPDCETYFRVSESDLEVAAGRVRCSQCDQVFDARAHLHSDDEPRPEPGSARPKGAEPPMGDMFANLESQPEPAFDAVDEPLDDLMDDAPYDGEADAARVVAGEADDGLDPMASEAELEPVVEAFEERLDAEAFDLPPLPVAGTRRPGLIDHAWSVAGVLLTLTLGAQLVHAYRVPLASAPTVGPLVDRAYAALDAPIAKPRDLGKVSVQRTEVTTHPLYDQVLMLSGVLSNEAAFAQDFPLLRVRLDDRWGELVGYRLFEPREYLRRQLPAGARFEPGQNYAIALEVVDPGSEAVGYGIEPCQRAGETIECLGENTLP
jgi:predicted Zn finger-like uncharacterized protein